MSPATEKRALQGVIAIACLVPLSAGLCGMIWGAAWLGGANSDLDHVHYLSGLVGVIWGAPWPSNSVRGADLDSHMRYLSGLLFAIGIGFASAIPRIEKHAERVRLLTLVVATGGAARLLGCFLAGAPGRGMQAAIVMELVVTPLICLWQRHLARRVGHLPPEKTVWTS